MKRRKKSAKRPRLRSQIHPWYVILIQIAQLSLFYLFLYLANSFHVQLCLLMVIFGVVLLIVIIVLAS